MRAAHLFFVLLLGLGFAPAAFAGQVHNEDVALERAVERAHLIVVVKLDSPAHVRVEIPVDLPGTKPGAKSCGTYGYAATTGTVVSVAHPAAHAPVAVGERIVIFPGNTGELLELTRLACRDGTSKSPIFERVTGGAQPTDGTTITALLRWEEQLGWVEAIAGGWMKAPPKGLESKRVDAFASLRKGDDALCVVDADCAVVVAPTFDADGGLTCGRCPPCALAADTPLAVAAARRFDAACARERARMSPATCEACAPTQKKAVCQAMRCVLKPAAPKAAP